MFKRTFQGNKDPWEPCNTPRRNGCHFPDSTFNCIFLNENAWIPIKISLKFVPKDQINNTPALVQTIAWCWPGNKPLSEPMMVRLPIHICVIQPEWAKRFLREPHMRGYMAVKCQHLIISMIIRCKSWISSPNCKLGIISLKTTTKKHLKWYQNQSDIHGRGNRNIVFAQTAGSTWYFRFTHALMQWYYSST